MKLTFYANACCSYSAEGKTLLCDPWLTDGAFYGSWFHYPPLKTTPMDVANADYIYISHLHPDHFDPETLKVFRRDIPIIYLDHGPNFLKRLIENEGFTNLIGIKDGETKHVGPFELTMYAPFVAHPFFDSSIGNLIDSALVVKNGIRKILNTNDNTPSLEAAAKLIDRHKYFDIVQLNYNAAGPYPSCLLNLTAESKLVASTEMIERNLNHIVRLAEVFRPRYVMPFAGAYVLGGKHWKKNYYLGTISADEAHVWLEERILKSGIRTLTLSEGHYFSLESLGYEVVNHKPTNYIDQHSYCKSLKDAPYPFSEMPIIDFEARCAKAAKRVQDAAKRFGYARNTKVTINTSGGQSFGFILGEEFSTKTRLDFWLVSGLLDGILDRSFHWNNAEIGCHIEFMRTPDEYDPDLHTLMSFFHV